MSETQKEALDPQAIDPPEGQGGGGGDDALSLEASSTEVKPLDPPEGNGGTGGGKTAVNNS